MILFIYAWGSGLEVRQIKALEKRHVYSETQTSKTSVSLVVFNSGGRSMLLIK